MSTNTKIEWTDTTWNPLRGCTKLSPGCKHCYAETFAERFRGVAGHPYTQGFDLRFLPEKLTEPFTWATPRRVFVNSMSDLFLAEVPEAFITAAVRVMHATPWHTYQVLTKRAERMAALLRGPLGFASAAPNIWWGVSVEDRRYGLPRVDALRSAPAAVRFLSVEPLLEALGAVDLTGIHWVINGGESGHGARPLDPAWVRSLRDRCAEAGVPFFFKQWGGRQKARAGRELDGRTHDAQPAVSAAPMPPRDVRLSEAARLDAAFAGLRALAA